MDESAEHQDVRDSEYAATVVQLVELAGGRLQSGILDAAALVLGRAGALDLTGVTFGCDYDLNVRSIELGRGYTRAINANLLRANTRETRLCRDPHVYTPVQPDVTALARSVFDLPREELERQARLLLLAADVRAYDGCTVVADAARRLGCRRPRGV